MRSYHTFQTSPGQTGVIFSLILVLHNPRFDRLLTGEGLQAALNRDY
jgi:hypothetical protein